MMYCGLLMLISLDGFMWNYLEKHGINNFPTFARIIKNGTIAKHVKPQFLTKTFPNHYTIVSGIYQEYHGIVNNNMYDERFNLTFKPGDTDKIWWENAPEPIWNTNQQASTHCLNKSGVYMWPGSNVKIHKQLPSRYLNFSKKVPLAQKFKLAINALSKNEINLAVTYHHEPDQTGHLFGPNSLNVADQIKMIDKDLEYLFALITEHGLSNVLNIIITSDHGMTQLNNDNKVILSEHIDVANKEVIFSGSSPTWNIFSNNSQLINHIKQVFGAKSFEGKLKIFDKHEIDRWHYKKHWRIGDLLIVGEPGWSIFLHPSKFFAKLQNGNHGYDNELPDSWPIFLATGPAFRKGFVSEPINNIDIYELMCAILNVKPAPNNGSIHRIKHLLTQDYNSSSNYRAAKTDLKFINHSCHLENFVLITSALTILCNLFY